MIKKKNKVIALTGGIGSGKSTALEIIKNAGFNTVSSDQIVRELYQKNSIKRKLKRLFPDAVFGKFFLSIDKKKIAERVFFAKDAHKRLTDLITPIVFKEIFKRAKRVRGTLFAEVPLLFECNSADAFDSVVVIVRSKSQRVNAVKERSNLSEEEILARMENQIDYDNADFSKYVVIENDGNFAALKNKIEEYLKTV